MNDVVALLSALTPVLTIVAGGLIGFLSARMMWHSQEQLRRKNIAAGLILEISTMEKMLSGYAHMLSGPGIFKIDTPVYPDTGLYRIFQREVFAFDAELARQLFEFYSRVLEAEQLRTLSPQDPRYRLMQEGAGMALTRAVAQMPALIAGLRKEAGSTALTQYGA
jgi:hypothetical protein